MGPQEYKTIIGVLVLCLAFFLVREFTMKDKALSKIEDLTKLITELEGMITETRMLISDMRMWAMDRFIPRDSHDTSIKELWESVEHSRLELFQEIRELREFTEARLKECRERCLVKFHSKT